MLEVKWCGFDYGQCIMEPGGLRNPLLFGDICKQLAHPEWIQDKIKKYRILKEKYKEYSLIKEKHRDEIYSRVLDNDPLAITLFRRKEQELLGISEGLEEALAYIQAQGIEIQVVTEMKKTLGQVSSNIVSEFIKSRGLTKYIKELITTEGKIDLESDRVDLKYKGYSKLDGSIYDILVKELKERGIEPDEAVMIGDKPETDINPAHDRGFKTIQYTGFVDLGPSKADFVIHSFQEVKTILKKKG